MKANELRIGNWVKTCTLGMPVMIPSINAQVQAIDIFSRIHFFHTPHNNGVATGLQHIAPIPLTPEILEMAGFRLQPQRQSIYLQGRIKLWMGHNGCIAYLKNEDSDDSYFIPGTCQHLHQLQNLYFALTGTELEINLNK